MGRKAGITPSAVPAGFAVDQDGKITSSDGKPLADLELPTVSTGRLAGPTFFVESGRRQPR
jgi:hypothetical protein